MPKLPLLLGPGEGQHAMLTSHRNWYTVTLSSLFVGDERLETGRKQNRAEVFYTTPRQA
jgi:hypothetical protein